MKFPRPKNPQQAAAQKLFLQHATEMKAYKDDLADLDSQELKDEDGELTSFGEYVNLIKGLKILATTGKAPPTINKLLSEKLASLQEYKALHERFIAEDKRNMQPDSGMEYASFLEHFATTVSDKNKPLDPQKKLDIAKEHTERAKARLEKDSELFAAITVLETIFSEIRDHTAERDKY